MSQRTKINLQRLPEKVAPVYMGLLKCRKRFIVLMGGRNSGKSFYACQHMLLKVISLPNRKVAVFRKIADSCRHSVFVRFQSEIARWGLTDLFKINQSSMEITFTPNGNKIIFLGMHLEKDRIKLKSIDGITDAWAEEASEFLSLDITDIDMIIRGIASDKWGDSSYEVNRGNAPCTDMQFILSFNPFFGSWLQTEYFDTSGEPRQDIEDAHVMVTTIDDNPWATDVDKKRLDILKTKDKELWLRYRRAKWTRLTGLIYDPPIIETEYPERFDYRIGGIDWGFNDPLVFLEIGIKDQEPYITEKIYRSGLTTEDLIDKYRENGKVEAGILTKLGIPKFYMDGKALFIQGISNERRKVNPEAYPIYCDGAEPDRILTLQNAGYLAGAAPKGPGSVKAGIDFCKGKTIHSRVENINTNREFELYKWKVDKNSGNTIDIPLSENDHAMDAMRYPLWAHIGKPSEAAHQEVRTTDAVEEFGDGLLPDVMGGW